MTTSTTPATSADMANTSLVKSFKDSLLPVIETERVLWFEMALLRENGDMSIRGQKATIEAVNNESGQLPTIKVSQCQYVPKALEVSRISGGETASLKDIINTTIQGMRKFGANGFNDALAEASTFSALAKRVDKAPAKIKAPKAPTPKGVEGLLIALAEAMASEDFDGILENPTLALAVAKQLNACARLASVA